MRRSRVTLDLHSLTPLMQGSRTYALNLALRLPALAPELEFQFHLPDPDGEEAARLKAPNVTLRATPHSRAARLLGFGSALRADRADLLHCQYLAPAFLPCRYVLTLHDVLHESHPAYYPGLMRLLMRRLYPRSARRAALVLTCSEHSRGEIVRRYGVPEERVLAIPLAAGEAFSPARGETERAEARETAARYGLRGRYVLYVGRLEPKKNIPGLVRAFRALPAEVRGDLTLALAGMADPLFADALTQNIGKDTGRDDGAVALLGRVAQEDLPDLYRCAELFAFPSHAEGFGLPPLEAMACGTPVVCSNATSLPEVVGDAGLLVAPDDVAGLARAMERILTDDELRARLTAKGGERSAGFSWGRTARATLAAYRQALQSPAR